MLKWKFRLPPGRKVDELAGTPRPTQHVVLVPHVNDIQHGGRSEMSALPAVPAQRGPKVVSPLYINDYSIVEHVNKLHHPSIPKLESVDDRENPSKKIVKEAATLNLRCIARYNEQELTCTTLTEGQVRYLLWPLASAVSCLHQNWIAHRNIKPGNIRVDEKDNVYLTGFGSAVKCEDPSMTVDGNHAGDISFLPPEMFDDTVRQFSGAAQDMWGLGVTLYMLLYGVHPFHAVCVSELEEYVCNKVPEFPDSPNVSENAKLLIKALLIKDPKERLTLEEVRKHPFLYEDSLINDIYSKDREPNITGCDLQKNDSEKGPSAAVLRVLADIIGCSDKDVFGNGASIFVKPAAKASSESILMDHIAVSGDKEKEGLLKKNSNTRTGEGDYDIMEVLIDHSKIFDAGGNGFSLTALILLFFILFL